MLYSFSLLCLLQQQDFTGDVLELPSVEPVLLQSRVIARSFSLQWFRI